MTIKIQKTTIGRAIACSLFTLMTQASPGALFSFRTDNAGTTDGLPTDDGQNFQQLWANPVNWILVSGEDDGLNGYPDGADTFTMDRTALVNNSTRLTNEGVTIGMVAGITGTGTGNQDIVFKHGGDNTIGDLTLLASPDAFHIREERDRSLTINGVISGVGDLLLSRSGGFSDGVDEDELITITGEAPNTITGTIRLWNASPGQPSYWVADKVGAFGQTPQLTLEGNSGATGITSLRITSNTSGGEGAIDDDATEVYIGAQGVLSMDADVNEVIGEGKLFIDLVGTGTYTGIDPGTYDNAEDWIIGDGTVTVGAFSSPLAITEITYALDAEQNPTVTLTWNSIQDRNYTVKYSTDLTDWTPNLGPGVLGDEGESTTLSFDLSDIPALDGVPKVFFRIEE